MIGTNALVMCGLEGHLWIAASFFLRICGRMYRELNELGAFANDWWAVPAVITYDWRYLSECYGFSPTPTKLSSSGE